MSAPDHGSDFFGALWRLGEDFAASPHWPEPTRRFETATRLEVGFFGMGLRGWP